MVHVKASGPLYNDVATQGSKLSFTSAEVGLSDEKNNGKMFLLGCPRKLVNG